MERRVVITGMGVVSCAGNSVPAFWESLLAGRSGIGPITLFDAAGLPSAAGEVRGFDLPELSPKEKRRMARCTRFAVGAAGEALTSAGLETLPEKRAGDPFRFGALISCGAGGLEVYDQGYEVLKSRGPNSVSAFFMPRYISNSVSGMTAIRYGLKGPNFDPVSACASSAHAIGEGAWMIRRGDADLMLAGGAEGCLTRLIVSGFNALTALSRITPPEAACRPFDRNRQGFVPAEGACILVLEELEHARKRGAPILAEIAGYGASCDATHITAPDPSGAGLAYAVRRALDGAKLSPAQVGAVYAHGTGTIANDLVESKVLNSVFREVRVSAVKSMIGHALSASAALGAAAAVKTLQTGLLPPTINCTDQDPACPLNLT
ncbi:MAG: beta-ketoacyl-[Lentisphaeria bacterium]|nr:beta-ketoacyl-[acyl-carrier-protein] synthase family protein [Lentisphaeria bacterium]